MSVQVSYKKQFLFGIILLLIILIVVEGFAKIWWYELESCAFEDSDLSNANFENSNLEDALGAPFIGCKNHPLCE